MMKKIAGSAFLAGVLLLIFSVSSISATQNIELYLDNHKVPTAPYKYQWKSGEVAGKYYIDVLPQIKGGRTYVPISTITTFLGADINWTKPTVTIVYDKTKLILTVDSDEAIKNGQAIKLDATPYVDKGRTMVPLRFISEAFGLAVNYKDNKVNIDFPTLNINDIAIPIMHNEFNMTMGSVISENKNDLAINRIYHVINSKKAKEIAAPKFFGSNVNLDVNDFYYELIDYSFKSIDNKTIAQYQIYTIMNMGSGTDDYAILDVLTSKWYTFDEDSYYKTEDLKNIGKWTIISNTVV